MKTNMKNVMLLGASLLMAGAVAVGANTATNVNATAVEGTFEMVTGASLRLSAENAGIRYQAKISPDVKQTVEENNGYFGMIVIPESYMTIFAEELTPVEGYVDYVTVLTQELEAKGYELWNRTNITPYQGYTEEQDSEYYYINGVVSSVLYDNYDLERLAIAYYATVDGDTTTYTYADFYTEEAGEKTYTTLRSVAGVANSAIKDIERYKKAPYDAEDRKVLYGYGYVSQYKTAGLAQPTDEAVLSYATNAVATEDTQTLLTFDETDSSANYKAATKTSNDTYQYYGKKTTFAVDANGEDGGNALTVIPDGNYAGVSVMFRPIKVEAGLMINLRLWKKASNLKFLPLNSTADANAVSNATADNEKWTTLSIKATYIGYEVGELISGFDLYLNLTQTDKTFKIDSVSISYVPVLADNELINFDGSLVDYSGNYGTISLNSSVNGNLNSANKVEPTLVKPGDEGYVATSKEGSGYVCAYESTYNNGYAGVKITFHNSVEITETTTFTIRLYKVQKATGDWRTWFGTFDYTVMPYETTVGTFGQWTSVAVKATDIGYKVGDIAKGIQIYSAAVTALYVDYITYAE